MLAVVRSSPRKHGNLKHIVIRPAGATRCDYRQNRLADLETRPRCGCIGCAHSKRWVRRDDMAPLYDELESVRGLIMGGNYNARANVTAYLFLERLYQLFHRNLAFRNEPSAVVAVGGETSDPAASDIVGYRWNIYFIRVVGSALITSDNSSCFSCGYGATCPVGIPALSWSRDARDALRQG